MLIVMMWRPPVISGPFLLPFLTIRSKQFDLSIEWTAKPICKTVDVVIDKDVNGLLGRHRLTTEAHFLILRQCPSVIALLEQDKRPIRSRYWVEHCDLSLLHFLLAAAFFITLQVKNKNKRKKKQTNQNDDAVMAVVENCWARLSSGTLWALRVAFTGKVVQHLIATVYWKDRETVKWLGNTNNQGHTKQTGQIDLLSKEWKGQIKRKSTVAEKMHALRLPMCVSLA